MPAKSKAQFRFMKLLEKNRGIMKKKPSMSPKAAKEYTTENVGKMKYSNLPEKK